MTAQAPELFPFVDPAAEAAAQQAQGAAEQRSSAFAQQIGEHPMSAGNVADMVIGGINAWRKERAAGRAERRAERAGHRAALSEHIHLVVNGRAEESTLDPASMSNREAKRVVKSMEHAANAKYAASTAKGVAAAHSGAGELPKSIKRQEKKAVRRAAAAGHIDLADMQKAEAFIDLGRHPLAKPEHPVEKAEERVKKLEKKSGLELDHEKQAKLAQTQSENLARAASLRDEVEEHRRRVQQRRDEAARRRQAAQTRRADGQQAAA